MAKILIVEDDTAIAQSYMMQLVKEHEVLVANDVATGMEMAAGQPDFILLDMLMPGLSGLDFLRQLEPQRTIPNTKIIAISNTESPKIIEEAKQLGVIKYLLKVDYTPGQIEALIAELSNAPTTEI